MVQLKIGNYKNIFHNLPLRAAEMVKSSGKHTGELKDQVTSPGGTTIAGIHALERGGVRSAIMDAVEKATQRAHELSKQ